MLRTKHKRLKRLHTSNHLLKTPSEPIAFELIRSSFRRSLAICIDEDTRVKVYAPYKMNVPKIFRFIEEKQQWIVDKFFQVKERQNIIQARQFDDGNEFLFLGKKCRLNVRAGDIKRSRVDFDGAKWDMTIPSHLAPQKRIIEIKKKLIEWYRAQAQEILGTRIFHYVRVMNIAPPKKIAVRTHKRIWGNCDYRTQTIHLNWQIVLSPLSVIDYVIVHELCHLFVPNHSKRFWKKVEKILPEYKQEKRWLKKHALELILP